MVENFGLYLKHERELRGVSLEEIAEATKIHIRFLEALENNEFDLLPGEVFIKGYIRAYAKVLGFDSEEMVNAYDGTVGKDRMEEFEKVRAENEKIRSRKKTVAGYVVGGMALLGVIFLGYVGVRSMIDSGQRIQGETVSTGDSFLQSNNAENLTKIEPTQEKEASETLEENSGQVMKADSLPDLSSSPAVDANIKEDAAVSNPPAPKNATPIAVPEEEKSEAVAENLSPKARPSSPLEEKEKEPKTPIKPAETEKFVERKEKPVIIQHVAENSGEAEKQVEKDFKPPEADSKPLHLMIQVQGNSWFNVTVDDGGEEDFILPGGSSKNIFGNEKFRVTIGNRRGTHLFLNGKSIDLPSGTNDVIRDFDITAKLIE
ncbi:MAG: helix-turn-helix domain-containing protein [Nitrospinaceae bacterium]|nr:MAG: helix-turn-helix domain-containing protein [Nitrospinaceae bacterium]